VKLLGDVLIVGITGTRDLGTIYPNEIYSYVYEQLENLFIYLEPDKIITGMAIGTDMLAAHIAKKHNIPYIAAIPYIGQEKLFSMKDKIIYDKLLAKAQEVVVVSEGGFANFKYLKRNEYIVNCSDKIIAVFNQDSVIGGTYHCFSYALKNNKEITIINPWKVGILK
jgi:uncharacterized phage-like protein YoqJ